jgi:Pectate lyase superfamily protein
VSSLLSLLLASTASAAIPPAAQTDFHYDLGYLVCDYYSGVSGSGTGDSEPGINDCIVDAYNNQLTAYLNTCGTYIIGDSLVLYKHQNMDASGKLLAMPPQNHVFRGRHACAGGTRPVVKLKANATGFTTASAPRPMVAFRGFEETSPSAIAGLKPSNPLFDPALHKEAGRNSMSNIFEGIDLDTNNNAGAIGLVNATAQNSGTFNVKVTATGSFAGLYAPPGRTSVTANVEVNGGQYGIISGKFDSMGLPLLPQQGNVLVGLKLTNQDVRAIKYEDTVMPVIVGFDITKSSDGPAIESSAAGMILKDGKIAMSGSAANDIVIENRNSSGEALNAYLSEVYISGSTQLVRSGNTVTNKVGTATWARIVEYAANDSYQKDANTTDPNTFPASYPENSSRFEARSVINGILGLAAIPINQLATGNPPADLITRHLWTTMPSLEDCPVYTNPLTFGATAYTGNSMEDQPSKANSSLAAFNTAITNATSAGHNCVMVPRGSFLMTNTLNLDANTKLIGAGPGKSVISYKDTWAPVAAVPLVQTADSASGTAYIGFVGLFVKSQPIANDYIYHLKWRTGKNSMMVAVGLYGQFLTKCNQTTGLPVNKQRYAWWFTGNGGGRFYSIQQNLPTNLDRHIDSRIVFLDGNTQPVTLYGNNLEGGKAAGCGVGTTNMEIKNVTAGVRGYGTKREGKSGSAIITASSNVGLYGFGAMTEGLVPNAEAYYRITGNSTNVVIAPTTVRNNSLSTPQSLVKEVISPTPSGGNFIGIPWPNGLSVYKRGTGPLDDSPFGASTPTTSPTVFGASVNVADRVDVKWTIYDGAAMLPASGATTFTVKVNGTAKTVTGAVRQGNDTYYVSITPGSLTLDTQAVLVSFAPGNVTAGASPNPAATTFNDLSAVNNLNPATTASFSQTSFAFRPLSGGAAVAEWYADKTGTFENVGGRFIPGAAFRVYMKMAANNADPPDDAFSVCWEKNESGTYALLTDDCTTDQTCFTDAPSLADGEPTIELLTPSESTFVPGVLLEHAGTTAAIDLVNNGETAIEAAIQTSTAAAINSRFRYRICKSDGTPLNGGYTNTPLVTITSPKSTLVGGGTSK